MTLLAGKPGDIEETLNNFERPQILCTKGIYIYTHVVMFGSMLWWLALVCERRNEIFAEPHYRFLEWFVVYREHTTTMETAREKATAAFIVTR